MSETTMLTQVTDRLSQLGYTVQSSESAALQFLIDKVTAEVKVKCNVDTVPDIMAKALIDRICGEYLQQLLGLGSLTGFNFDASVKAITEGDSSFSFAENDSEETKFSKVLLQLIGGLDDLVVAYRKLRW